MADTLVLLFVGLIVGLVVAGVVSLWHGETKARRFVLGLLVPLSAAYAIAGQYAAWVNQSVHGDGKFPFLAVALAELACAAVAFPIGLKVWPWLKTKRKGAIR